VKWVHAADLHLDSPLRGLDRYEGAPVARFRGATRRALENLVDLCLEEGAALLLLAGDLYDGDWKDYATGLFFAQQMSRLREGDVQVVWIRGNHDAASQLTKHLRLPANVQELPTRKPATVELPDLGVTVHGQGFPKRAVTEDLAARYPDPVPGVLNVGLLHTALGGRPGHARYAPTSAEVLRQRGYDYWALGHVHTREVVSEDPWIVFPGNLQGRHLRETGAKGATVVEVRDGRIAQVGHRVLDVVRWDRVAVDVAEAAVPDDAVDLARDALEAAQEAAGDRPLAARLVLEGATAAHPALQRQREAWEETLRAMATDLSGDGVWLADVELATAAETGAGGRSLPAPLVAGVLERLDAALRTLADDPAALGDLAGDLEDLRKKLPPGLRDEDPPHALSIPKHPDTSPAAADARDDEEAPDTTDGDEVSDPAEPAQAPPIPPGLADAVRRVRRWLPARLTGHPTDDGPPGGGGGT